MGQPCVAHEFGDEINECLINYNSFVENDLLQSNFRIFVAIVTNIF